jgi:hypothetical protein
MRYIKLLAAILTCMTVFTSFAGCATKSGFGRKTLDEVYKIISRYEQ